MHARPKSRGNRWLPLLFIAIIGLTVGLTYAWFINPVQYVDVEPSQLAEEQRRTFLILVSLTYASDGNIDGAPLATGRPWSAGSCCRCSKGRRRCGAAGPAETSVRALTNLALALGGQPEVAAAFAGPVVSPTQSISSPASQATIPAVITVTPSLTPTLLATLTPSTTTPEDGEGTPSATPQQQQFVLVDLTTFCDEEHIPGIIVIQVQDADGSGLTGVEVRVGNGGQSGQLLYWTKAGTARRFKPTSV